jgi:hypothetical protein
VNAPLMFPVGHYLGPLYPAVEAPLAYHRLRAGGSVIRLFTDDEFAVWTLAHGLPGPGGAPWTGRAMADAALAHDGSDISPLIAELCAEGALVEVEPGTDGAVDFAMRHRFRGLLVGLGSTEERPDRFGIGLAGLPMVMVDELGYELWQWAPLHGSLWNACVALVEVDRQAGGAHTDPHELLTDVLHQLHRMLAHGAGYLDESTAA